MLYTLNTWADEVGRPPVLSINGYQTLGRGMMTKVSTPTSLKSGSGVGDRVGREGDGKEGWDGRDDGRKMARPGSLL